MGLLRRTINRYTLLIVQSKQNQHVLFMLLSPLSLCMYVEGVNMNGWRHLHLQPFWTWCRMKCWVFFKPILQQCFTNAVISPEWIWFQCTASTHVIQKGWKWNDSIRPVILCPCALNNSIFPSLQRLVDNISVVDMVCLQLLQNIIPTLMLLYNSLCLVFWKHSGSVSLNIFSGRSVFDISWSFSLMHFYVWCKIGGHN